MQDDEIVRTIAGAIEPYCAPDDYNRVRRHYYAEAKVKAERVLSALRAHGCEVIAWHDLSSWKAGDIPAPLDKDVEIRNGHFALISGPGDTHGK